MPEHFTDAEYSAWVRTDSGRLLELILEAWPEANTGEVLVLLGSVTGALIRNSVAKDRQKGFLDIYCKTLRDTTLRK